MAQELSGVLFVKKNSKPEPLKKKTNKQTNNNNNKTPGTAINSEVIEVRRRSRILLKGLGKGWEWEGFGYMRQA